MKLGGTHIRISCFGIDAYKVSILSNDMHDVYGKGWMTEFVVDYKAGDQPLREATRAILQMVIEQLGR